MIRPIRPNENDTPDVTAARLDKLLGKDVGNAEVAGRSKHEIETARAKLRPFNGAATCPACGGGAVATTFHAKHSQRWDALMERLLNIATSYVPFDLLERRCTRCGKSWAELPLSDGREVTK